MFRLVTQSNHFQIKVSFCGIKEEKMTKKNKNNDPGWCNLSLARDHVSRIMITRLPVYQHKEREEEAEFERERKGERERG